MYLLRSTIIFFRTVIYIYIDAYDCIHEVNILIEDTIPGGPKIRVQTLKISIGIVTIILYKNVWEQWTKRKCKQNK